MSRSESCRGTFVPPLQQQLLTKEPVSFYLVIILDVPSVGPDGCMSLVLGTEVLLSINTVC